MGSLQQTGPASKDNQTCAAVYLLGDSNGPLGHSKNRPGLGEESQKPDCLPATGGFVRGRYVPWLLIPDFFMVQEIRAAKAIQSLLLVFNPSWRLQRIARVRHF